MESDGGISMWSQCVELVGSVVISKFPPIRIVINILPDIYF